MRGWRRSRGQALPLVALELWVIAGIALLVALVGERAVDRARAQVGADAVALAAAVDPGSAAALAGQNGVYIESLEGGTTVDVVVSIGGASAAASAELNRPEWEGLDPSMLTALRVAEAHLGERLVVISGLRTRAEQARLWANRDTNPFPVAPPGTSRHEAGLAVDVSIDTAVRLADVAGQAGLCRPLPVVDPVHFIVC